MRKRRTREHIIADISVNYVERYIFRQGHVADRVLFDYGYDLVLRTFNANGEIEPAFLMIQIKASDNMEYVLEGKFVALRIDARDREAWQNEQTPVILIAYDATKECAYWLYFQALEEEARGRGTVRIPTDSIYNEMAVEAIRQIKNQYFEISRDNTR
jgi:Domain of unknown function (DUF4365)